MSFKKGVEYAAMARRGVGRIEEEEEL